MRYNNVQGSLPGGAIPVKTLYEIQREVDEYIGQFEEGYFPPMSLVVRLAEELGELAREINHEFGEKRKKPDEPPGSPALELGDLFFVSVCLANSLGIDLTETHERVMEKFRTRDKDRFTRKIREE